MTLKQRIDEISQHHANKAAQSPYDTKVAIVAIGSAIQVLESFSYTDSPEQDVNEIITRLTKLRDAYNDTSGEYTSGKGEIGSLLREIEDLSGDYRMPERRSLSSRIRDWFN